MSKSQILQHVQDCRSNEDPVMVVFDDDEATIYHIRTGECEHFHVDEPSVGCAGTISSWRGH